MDKKTWMLRPETIKLEENIGNMLFDISLSSFGGDMSLQVRETTNKQMWIHQTENLLCNKGNYKQDKKQPTEWEKIFANDLSDKGLISKICKQLIQLNI